MVSLMQRRREMMRHQIEISEYFFTTAKFLALGSDLTHNNKACQGGCVVGNVWYAFVYNDTEDEQYLYSYNLASKDFTLLNTFSTLGHVNSLTYDPDHGVFYVASMVENVGIAVIDASDYSLLSTWVARRVDTTIWTPTAIAYDRTKKVLYAWAKIYDSIEVFAVDGTPQREIQLSDYTTYTTSQGMETDGKFLYLCWSDHIEVHKINGDHVKSVSFSDKELEEIGYDWNGNFYGQEYVSNGKMRVVALLFGTVNGWANMSYIPFSFDRLDQRGGTITPASKHGASFVSTASARWTVCLWGQGNPFTSTFLTGKTCRVSFDLVRTAGGSGYVSSAIFTGSRQNPTVGSSRLYFKSKSFGASLPVNETVRVSYDFVVGSDDFAPSSSQNGYVCYQLYLYADSGNSFKVENYKFEVYLGDMT